MPGPARLLLALLLLLLVGPPAHQAALLGGDPAIVPSHTLYFANPNDGETMQAVAQVTLVHDYWSAVRVVVRAGPIYLASQPITGSVAQLTFDSTQLPNGAATLTGELIDGQNHVLAATTVTVVISHPTLEVLSVGDAGEPKQEVLLRLHGLAEDQVFTLLASDALEDSYFQEFDQILPLCFEQTVHVAAGLFPSGYGGGPVDLAVEFDTPPAPTRIYLCLLTYRISTGWQASAVVPITLGEN